MNGKRNMTRLLATISIVAAMVGAVAATASAGRAEVTRGQFATFAAGGEAGYDIGGQATMVRNADMTRVAIHVTGLVPGETYVSHVHNQACADGDAGGHFKQDATGMSQPPNEIWPGNGTFSSNAAGIVNVNANVDYFANSDARSVVVHWKTSSGAPKIACADLS